MASLCDLQGTGQDKGYAAQDQTGTRCKTRLLPCSKTLAAGGVDGAGGNEEAAQDRGRGANDLDTGRVNVFVKKKYGTMRVTSDFRELNEITVTDTYAMEDFRATLDCMGTKSIFATFDLKESFFQIELENVSRGLPAICTVFRPLRYIRLPQRMKNSPVAFKRVLFHIPSSKKGLDIWAFMYDVSMGMATVKERRRCLDSALKIFCDDGARLKLSKCQFVVCKAKTLGHRIYRNGIKSSDAHVEAMRRLGELGGGEELMRLLELINFFSNFFDHFSEIARPLQEVLVGTGFNKKN